MPSRARVNELVKAECRESRSTWGLQMSAVFTAEGRLSPWTPQKRLVGPEEVALGRKEQLLQESHNPQTLVPTRQKPQTAVRKSNKHCPRWTALMKPVLAGEWLTGGLRLCSPGRKPRQDAGLPQNTASRIQHPQIQPAGSETVYSHAQLRFPKYE